MGCVSDLDAKPCEADLDAHGSCRGYNIPLAMMGVALDRYLPERNAMLVTKAMYFGGGLILFYMRCREKCFQIKKSVSRDNHIVHR